MFKACAVLVAGLALAGCVQQAALPPDIRPARMPTEAPEVIPVNLKTSWPDLLAAVESQVARCTDLAADGTCADAAGDAAYVYREEDSWAPIDQSMLGQPLGVKIAVWRTEPVSIAVTGSHITASLKLLYRVRVGLMSGRQVASCGFGEAPREMTVQFEGDVDFDPDWALDPDFRVDILPGARCAVSLLKLDITDQIISPLRDALQKEADNAADRVRAITDVHALAASLWASFAEPVSLGNRVWLESNLVSARARLPTVTSDGRYLLTTIGIESRPRIVIGRRPTVHPSPLPPLADGPVDSAFSIKVRGLIDYAEAARMIQEHVGSALGPQSLHGMRIHGVTVSGRGNAIVVAIEVRGSLSVTLYFFGVPRFEGVAGNVAGGTLTLDRPRFTYTANGPLSGLLVSLFSARIEAALAASAWWDATPYLRAAVKELEAAVNRPLTPEARLEGKLTSFGPGQVRVGPDGLEAWYRIGGTVDVTVTPFK